MIKHARPKIGLVQIGEQFGRQYYLPYSIGILQAHAQKKLADNFDFSIPLYKRIKVVDAVSRLLGSDIVFFSAYLWNYRLSLSIAKALKNADKNCLIVFGGPQVPEIPKALEYFLRNNRFVDVACYGEGEVPFAGILEKLTSRDFLDTPSLGFIDKNNIFVFNTPMQRLDLNEIPSPYLEGVFDRLIAEDVSADWAGLLETNRGCPFTCAYCYWGLQSRSNVFHFDLERVEKEIDWFSRNKIEFIFCCDANFGMFERDTHIALKIAENKKKYGYPQAFSVQNTKNSTGKIFDMQKTLHAAGLQKGVNLALQSVNKETLKSINRSNISFKTYQDLQTMFNKEGIATFSDMIIGLPNETYDTFTEGAAKVIESGQHNRIQFINLTILENTAMAGKEYQSEHGFLIKEVDIISHHTSLDDITEAPEKQNLVVGTLTMSAADWVRTRVFCWMTSLLYFNKLFQIPIMLVNKLTGISYRRLLEIFINSNEKYPIISEITDFFIVKARAIQKGECEYVAGREYLNIWWPADEYMFIKLCVEDKLAEFYKDASLLLDFFLKKEGLSLPDGIVDEAVSLNKRMIKQPFMDESITVNLCYNVFDFYKGALNGRFVELVKGEFKYVVERRKEKWSGQDDWCREVVWYGTKKGAYLYDCV